MLDDTLNSNSEEVVQPQDEMNSNSEEVVQPQKEITPEDIMSMSSEEFSEYLVHHTVTPDEVTPAEIVADTQPEPDTSVVSGETDDVVQDNVQAEPAPYRVYKTEDEFNADVNEAFRNRMRKHKDEDEKIQRLKDMARAYYGDADPLTALMGDLETQAADRENISVDVYRERESEKRDAEAYRKQQKAIADEERRRQDVTNAWKRDSEQLKVIDPDFDFGKSFNGNDVFRENIMKGNSVAQAYMAMKKAETPPPKPERKEIMQNGTGKVKGTGGSGIVNPASFSDKKFKDYIEKCRNA